jgi:hypothetical protein
MNILGKWEGYYQYGEGYVLPQFGERVQFMALIEEGEESEGFVGTVDEDASEFTVALMASLKGYVEGELVSFIKTYEENPRLEEGKKRETLEIEHQGYMDEKHNAMYGSWLMEEIQQDEEGDYEAVCTGTWFLKKVE